MGLKFIAVTIGLIIWNKRIKSELNKKNSELKQLKQSIEIISNGLLTNQENLTERMRELKSEFEEEKKLDKELKSTLEDKIEKLKSENQNLLKSNTAQRDLIKEKDSKILELEAKIQILTQRELKPKNGKLDKNE